jgi:hypothetical protein
MPYAGYGRQQHNKLYPKGARRTNRGTDINVPMATEEKKKRTGIIVCSWP